MRTRSGKHGAQRIEHAVAALARMQYGVISRAQLLEIGLSRDTVGRWVRHGRLHPIFRGVYLVGHSVPPPLAREMAAVHACGKDRTLLSHESATHMWGLALSGSNADVVVTTIGAAPKLRGIHAHRVSDIDPKDRLTKKRIPLTSVARTLLDMAAIVEEAELERMVALALRRHLVSRSKLKEVLERYPRRKGAGPLRALLAARTPKFTRSEAERRMLALVRRAGLPEPETNVPFGPYELDFYWREQRLVVEVDGYGSHSSRVSFESDRRRDAELLAAGIRTARVTWDHLCDEPDRVAYRLKRSLSVRS